MRFRESDHSYTYENKKYTSVTTLYKYLKKSQDWNMIAEKYAIKNGETAQFWLDKWETNRDESASFGSLYHLKREFGTIEVDTSDDKYSLDLDTLEDGDYKELIIYSHYYKVSGQADRVTIKDGVVTIRDYKTCKKIDTEATAYYRAGKGKVKERYLPPISHLDVFNLNDFALQLSIYSFMLELYGFKIDKLIIEHIKFSERDKGYTHLMDCIKNNTLKEEIVDYEVPYLREEAYRILENHRNTHYGRDFRH